jgi:HPt (histidine-containing phosphotransfer) domain-containing protein
LYTIHLHAIKSASANIGAAALSEAAKALEMAGEKKDLDFIEAYNAMFLIDLKSLLGKINDAVSIHKNAAKEKSKPLNIELLKSELTMLKIALDVFDAGAINKIVNNLQDMTLPEDIENAVEEISSRILVAEYDRATELIDSLTETLFKANLQ